MTRRFRSLLAVAALLASGHAHATPSTTFWTPATTYVQPFLVPHVTYDTYFGRNAAYPVDTGIEIGVLPFEKLQAEVGFDLLLPQPAPNGLDAGLLLNGKIGAPEGAFGAWQPGISAGIMGVGFKSDVSDYDLLHGELSKTLPLIGTVVAGAYYGLNDKLFVDDKGQVSRAGFLAAYVTPDVPIGLPGLDKINFFGDVQTGNSAYAAAGGGIGLYFTPAIDVLTGPVFFLNPRVQPGGTSWMWSVQLDVDLDLFKKTAPART